MADFRNVVSVLPAARLIKAVSSFRLILTVIKASRIFVAEQKAKQGAIFSLIYFFKSFCLYYIPHNYVIPQAMPRAISQTHSVFYPHRHKSH